MNGFTSSEALTAFAINRPPGCIVVATMTAIGHLFRLSPSPRNVSCVPLMGGAGSLGLGIALARPDEKVVVFDGDGSLLMQLGGLVSIAGIAPKNLVHVVMNNGVWFENMANLPLPGRCAFQTTATAAGFSKSYAFDNRSDWAEALPDLMAARETTFVELKIEPETGSLWTASSPQLDLPDAQFTRMGKELRNLSDDLGVEL